MHFARGFKRLFNYSPPSTTTTTTTTIGELHRYILHCHSFLSAFFFLFCFPLFCMLFSFPFYAWTICTSTMTISLLRRILFYVILKPVYFNYAHCLFLVLIFVFFSHFHILFGCLLCVRSSIDRSMVTQRNCIVKFIVIQYIPSRYFTINFIQNTTNRLHFWKLSLICLLFFEFQCLISINLHFSEMVTFQIFQNRNKKHTHRFDSIYYLS